MLATAIRRGRLRRLLLVLLTVVVVLVLILASLIVVASRHASVSGRVYTVPQVRTGLQSNPRAWAGRTVQVRGEILQAYWTHYSGAQPPPDPWHPPVGTSVHLLLGRDDLRDVQSPAAVTSGLWLRPRLAAPSPLLTFLRRVPLLGGLLPAPPGLLTSAVYRVRLLSPYDGSSARCASGICDAGVLLDVVQ